MGNSSDDRVSVRFPTLEVFALRSGGALSTRSRRLSPDERAKAQSVFGSSLDLTPIRILATPGAGAPFTLGNNIRSRTMTLPIATLIHELTHVWQYQTKGMRYVSDSVFHQTKAAITTGSRAGAYAVKVAKKKSLHSYTAEQQATIVEHYFAYPQFRRDPQYQALIKELRKSRPMSGHARKRLVLEEIAYGSGQAASRITGGRRQFRIRGAPTVPILRIEF